MIFVVHFYAGKTCRCFGKLNAISGMWWECWNYQLHDTAIYLTKQCQSILSLLFSYTCMYLIFAIRYFFKFFAFTFAISEECSKFLSTMKWNPIAVDILVYNVHRAPWEVYSDLKTLYPQRYKNRQIKTVRATRYKIE